MQIIARRKQVSGPGLITQLIGAVKVTARCTTAEFPTGMTIESKDLLSQWIVFIRLDIKSINK